MAKEKISRERIDSPELVNEFFGTEMRGLQKESLRVLLLDTRYRFLETHEISLGSVNERIAHHREVFRPALLVAAYAIIVVHNHPSGDPTRSSADHSPTRRLAEPAELLQVTLLHHLILGSPAEG